MVLKLGFPANSKAATTNCANNLVKFSALRENFYYIIINNLTTFTLKMFNEFRICFAKVSHFFHETD